MGICFLWCNDCPVSQLECDRPRTPSWHFTHLNAYVGISKSSHHGHGTVGTPTLLILGQLRKQGIEKPGVEPGWKFLGSSRSPKWQRQAYKIWFLLPSWYYSNLALVGPEEFQKVHLICSCLLHILLLISLNTQDSVCSLLLCPQKTWCLLVGSCIFFSFPLFSLFNLCHGEFGPLVIVSFQLGKHSRVCKQLFLVKQEDGT